MDIPYLLELVNRLLNSADDTGCDGDLTVVSKSALEAVEEYLFANDHQQ